MLGALAAAPWSARAARDPRRKRLAILFNGPRELAHPPFVKDTIPLLAEHGWIDGRTVEFLLFYFGGPAQELEPLVLKVVEARPDAIWTAGTPVTRALQRATSTIPIVTTVGDPVEAGFARSLARPGGNITGTSHGTSEWFAKMAEIVKFALPRLEAVAAIQGVRVERVPEFERAIRSAFRAQGVEAAIHLAKSLDEVRTALRALPSAGRGAAFLQPGPGQSIADWCGAAIDLRVPTIGDQFQVVKAGALLSQEYYRGNGPRRVIAILDMVLRGADPATIPFELPERSMLTVNLKTARAIGITFSPDFLLRADRVIE